MNLISMWRLIQQLIRANIHEDVVSIFYQCWFNIDLYTPDSFTRKILYVDLTVFKRTRYIVTLDMLYNPVSHYINLFRILIRIMIKIPTQIFVTNFSLIFIRFCCFSVFYCTALIWHF